MSVDGPGLFTAISSLVIENKQPPVDVSTVRNTNFAFGGTFGEVNTATIVDSNIEEQEGCLVTTIVETNEGTIDSKTNSSHVS